MRDRRWKSLVYRHKWGIVAANVYQDLLRRTGIVSGQISNPYTRARAGADLVHAVNAVNHTFDNYSRHMELLHRVRGARVLEVGPGHNIGVALRFVAEGASLVVCLDKFVPFQDTPFHRMLYRKLRDELGGERRLRFDEAIQLEPSLRVEESRLRYVFGRSIDAATDLFPPQTFDVIVSNAVIEEAYDTDAAFRAMDRLLAPGGRMMHAIDLRDYGMFTKHGFHPLEFLTVPDAIYRRMVECVGQPNRQLVNYYRATMAALGYTSTIDVTWLVGAAQGLPTSTTSLTRGVDYSHDTAALIEAIRPRLLPRYRTLPQEDLAVASIQLEAVKPEPTTMSAHRLNGLTTAPSALGACSDYSDTLRSPLLE